MRGAWGALLLSWGIVAMDMARRSVLFSPGDQPTLMEKAPTTGADTVVFDLEDAVAPDQKADAREMVNDVLTDPGFIPECEVCLRVNPDPDVAATDLDVALAGTPRIDAVMVPKAVEATIADLVALVQRYGNDLTVFALCESAQGVLDAAAIATTPGVAVLGFGAEDLSADIGATRTADGDEVGYARQHVVVAAGAADIDVVDTVYTDIEDTDGLAAATEKAATLGFDGKMAIHPAQVPVINAAFTPSADKVSWAKNVLAARDEAAASDRGVFRVDGEMIDAPLITRAERIMERHRAADATGDQPD